MTPTASSRLGWRKTGVTSVKGYTQDESPAIQWEYCEAGHPVKQSKAVDMVSYDQNYQAHQGHCHYYQGQDLVDPRRESQIQAKAEKTEPQQIPIAANDQNGRLHDLNMYGTVE